MDIVLIIILQAAIGFTVLLITGRIFDKLNSECESTWLEDMQAAGIIVALTTIASLIPAISSFTILVYFGLIYYAFQLDGFIDAITFYVIHVFIGAGVGFLLNLASLSLPIMETLER
ncbi:MAG: hypothetical protein JXR73_20700 [Candidatus Omnitrophica bacterium]|nr:hypothetical protein [Candidatus Omnitrophota bacterium]